MAVVVVVVVVLGVCLSAAVSPKGRRSIKAMVLRRWREW